MKLGILILFLSRIAFSALPIWQEPFFIALTDTKPTPFYISDQYYLNDAPQGIGAKDAWNLPGGFGENVKIIDLEVGFNKGHEDLGDVFHNEESILDDHGTAVVGIINGQNNAFGITGIAPLAKMGFYGFPEGEQEHFDEKYLSAILKALQYSAKNLEAGDVLLVEQQLVGPDRDKHTAIEYWPEIFNELKKITDSGIHCVAAAGNGNSDFDSPSYNGAFDLKVRDSGCILVGAASMTHHERLHFSNFGSRIDVHGYGEYVATTGYGDLFNGGTLRLYTSYFNGTSSAAPIVAGVVAVISSIEKEKGRLVTPSEMREALRKTGTKQGRLSREKKIGNMPYIQDALKYLNQYRQSPS